MLFRNQDYTKAQLGFWHNILHHCVTGRLLLRVLHNGEQGGTRRETFLIVVYFRKFFVDGRNRWKRAGGQCRRAVGRNIDPVSESTIVKEPVDKEAMNGMSDRKTFPAYYVD